MPAAGDVVLGPSLMLTEVGKIPRRARKEPTSPRRFAYRRRGSDIYEVWGLCVRAVIVTARPPPTTQTDKVPRSPGPPPDEHGAVLKDCPGWGGQPC